MDITVRYSSVTETYNGTLEDKNLYLEFLLPVHCKSFIDVILCLLVG